MRYRAQFASLDSLLAGLQSTSRYLESTLLRDRSR
jgi:flagellar capping protein FliD